MTHRKLTKPLKEMEQLALKENLIQNEEALVSQHFISRKQVEKTTSSKHVTSCGLGIITYR